MDLKYNFKLLLICHTHNRQKPPNRIQNRNPCKGSEIRRQRQGVDRYKDLRPGKRQNLQCRHRVQGCKDTQGIWQHPWYWQDCILDKNRRVRNNTLLHYTGSDTQNMYHCLCFLIPHNVQTNVFDL